MLLTSGPSSCQNVIYYSPDTTMALRIASEGHTRIYSICDEPLKKSDVLESIGRNHGAKEELPKQENTKIISTRSKSSLLFDLHAIKGNSSMSISDKSDTREKVSQHPK